MALELDKDAVRERLIEIASRKDIVSYSDLAADFGQIIRDRQDSLAIGELLGVISKDENREGRPLLSAIVVEKGTGWPGNGFFGLAHKLGHYDGSKDEKAREKYASDAINAVHDYWGNRQLSPDELDELEQFNQEFEQAKPESREVVVECFERKSEISERVKILNGRKCQVCEALGQNPFGFMTEPKNSNKERVHYIEAHHVEPISSRRAGVLHPSNIITVCANHHRQLHYGNVELDEDRTTDDTFVFIIDGETVAVSRIKLD